MNSTRLLAASLLLLWLPPGCQDDHDHDKPAAATAASDKDELDHGHAHSHEPEMKETLGLVNAGPYEVVAVQNSKLELGGEMNFDVEILGQPRPKAVRFWIGTEAGEGSSKSDPLSEKENVFHVDIDLPASLPQNSKLWVEIDQPDGAALRAAFDLRT